MPKISRRLLFPIAVVQIAEADEVTQWIKLVACRDPSWWTEEHLECLGNYCRVIVEADRISSAVDACNLEEDPINLMRLHTRRLRLTGPMLDAHSGAFE